MVLRAALQNLYQAPALVARQRPTLLDRDQIAGAALAVLVVRQQLRRAALVLAVLRVRHVALDQDRDRLLHLGADDAAGQRLDLLGLLVRGRFSLRAHAFLPLLCSPCTVFRRAMFRRTFVNWSGFTSWPVARVMRRLNCSRRSSSSSFCRSAPDFARNSFAVLIDFNLVYRTWRVTNCVSTDSLDAASRNASRAIASVTPSISNSTLPGFTFAT